MSENSQNSSKEKKKMNAIYKKAKSHAISNYGNLVYPMQPRFDPVKDEPYVTANEEILGKINETPIPQTVSPP